MPITIEPSIWAIAPFGLMVRPQSTAATTRWTRTRPESWSSEISATSATTVPPSVPQAIPCALPAGGVLPQPARSAAAIRTARIRWPSASSGRCASRNWNGSAPAACASSSTKLSTANRLAIKPSPRQDPVGIGIGRLQATVSRLAMA